MSAHDLRVAPARPHQRLTEDGRRMREVLSYSRRGSRFTPSQQEAWDAHADAWVVPDHEVDRAGVDVRTWFGREAPLVVEIGCGVGEATGVLAAARPESTCSRSRSGAPEWPPRWPRSQPPAPTTCASAPSTRPGAWSTWCPRAASPSCGPSSPTPGPRPGTTSAGWSRPPSPRVVAARLQGGGLWRLATDWADYAEQMLEVLDAEPALEGGGCRGGRTGRSRSSSARGARPAARSPISPTAGSDPPRFGRGPTDLPRCSGCSGGSPGCGTS